MKHINEKNVRVSQKQLEDLLQHLTTNPEVSDQHLTDEQIISYVSGELLDPVSIETHLRSCEKCSAEVERLTSISKEAPQIRGELLEALHATQAPEKIYVDKAVKQLEEVKDRPDQIVLVTGGAGFIGANLSHRLASSGYRVRLLDNLSRPGVENNLRWLRETHGDRVTIEVADVRDLLAVQRAAAGVDTIFHFAAQVAVTTSLIDPGHDFDINVRGTFNVLEAARRQETPPAVLFTSTNKVYGRMEDLVLRRRGNRYEPTDEILRARGFSEDRRLDFHSPYGCSKGAADQYVLDYALSYGLRTAVFRMGSTYGPHQFGTEDQGWIAHFLICVLDGRPLTLYGDGMQVRDILYVEDLVEAFLLAKKNISVLAGQAFNIGGGPTNTISPLELVNLIGTLHGSQPEIFFEDWRTGDQRYYVSDISKFATATGWKPRVDVRQGVDNLYNWLLEPRNIEYEKRELRDGVPGVA